MDYNAILNYITLRSAQVPTNQIKGASSLAPEEALLIYREDYRARLIGVLRSHYPVTQWILGEELFTEIAQAYCVSTPSSSWDINVYGDQFSSHLATEAHARDYLSDVPFIADMARIEWHSHLYFHEAQDTDGTLLALPSETSRLQALKLSSQLRLFRSSYNIPALYQAALNKQPGFPAHWEEPSYYFLSKQDFTVQLEALPFESYQFLEQWQRKGTLGELLEHFDKFNLAPPLDAETLLPLLQRMVQLHFLKKSPFSV